MPANQSKDTKFMEIKKAVAAERRRMSKRGALGLLDEM